MMLGAAVSGRGSPYWEFCGNHILLVLCSIVYFFTLILLICIKSLRMLIPVNYTVLVVNTITMAFMFGAATKNDNFEYWFSLICALMLVTCGLFAAVMLVRTASKLRLGMCIAVFCAIVLQALIGIPFYNAGFFLDYWRTVAACSLVILVISVYIYFDLVVANRLKYSKDDDYIKAALHIICDPVIYLWIVMVAVSDISHCRRPSVNLS